MIRYFIGGPLDGQTKDINNTDYYRTYNENYCSQFGNYDLINKPLTVYMYTPRVFGVRSNRYIVMVLSTLTEEEVLMDFEMNISKIQVESYLPFMYSGSKESNYHQFKRRYFMNNLVRVGPSGNIGKYTKRAVMMICYGGGDKRTVEQSGLSLRRVKVLRRAILGFGGMMFSEEMSISGGILNENRS